MCIFPHSFPKKRQWRNIKPCPQPDCMCITRFFLCSVACGFFSLFRTISEKNERTKDDGKKSIHKCTTYRKLYLLSIASFIFPLLLASFPISLSLSLHISKFQQSQQPRCSRESCLELSLNEFESYFICLHGFVFIPLNRERESRCIWMRIISSAPNIP